MSPCAGPWRYDREYRLPAPASIYPVGVSSPSVILRVATGGGDSHEKRLDPNCYLDQCRFACFLRVGILFCHCKQGHSNRADCIRSGALNSTNRRCNLVSKSSFSAWPDFGCCYQCCYVCAARLNGRSGPAAPSAAPPFPLSTTVPLSTSVPLSTIAPAEIQAWYRSRASRSLEGRCLTFRKRYRKTYGRFSPHRPEPGWSSCRA